MPDADATPTPEAGQTLNEGPPVVPRPAATVILLRGGSERLELLLVQRNPQARFMGGAWVFPGGAVDASEGAGDDALRAAAVRELREEAGVSLPDPASLVAFSRWITPAQVTIRYDTHFYLAPMPDREQPRVDGQECVALGWFTPGGALAAHADGSIALVFPTIKHLEQLTAFASADALLDHARSRTVEPVEPRVVMEGEVARIVLPGEPGY
jgi:8-oxo-dGTP pyrophosphatase MutT (NUDIX family)